MLGTQYFGEAYFGGSSALIEVSPVKNVTKWLPPSGQGYIKNVDNESIITNAGLFLTDNLGNFLVTTPITIIPKFISDWARSTKNNTLWVNKNLTTFTAYNIVDQSSNNLVDPSGNQIVDTGESASGKSVTSWTGSGV